MLGDKNEEIPEAYAIGWQPFIGLKIYLDSHPLIPRTETEYWTDLLLKDAVARRLKDVSDGDGRRDSKFLAKNYACPEDGVPLRLLDLCAGSGAIGCAALAKLPNAQVYFGEIDPAHEATILKNIRENNLNASPYFAKATKDTRADVRIGDLFEPFGDLKFDIIAINPPYIPADRILPKSVADYEPALALYSGTDGLELMRKIAAELPKHLAKVGQAWIEIDSAAAATAAALFTDQGLSAEIRNDQYDKPRVIVVSFK